MLVVDFGGGTFDISIVCVSDSVLDVQATRGDMLLGGMDLDHVIMDLCEKKIYADLVLKDEMLSPQDYQAALTDMIRRKL